MLTRRQLLQRCRRRVRADRAGGLAPGRGPARAASPTRAQTTRPGGSLKPDGAAAAALPGRAKRVIWIFINGGPSQVDTWDYKPALARWDGKSIREFDPSFKNTTGFFKNEVGRPDEVAVPVHARGASAARWSRRSSRTWAGTSTRWRSSTRSSPSRTTTRRPSS